MHVLAVTWGLARALGHKGAPDSMAGEEGRHGEGEKKEGSIAEAGEGEGRLGPPGMLSTGAQSRKLRLHDS